MDIQYRKDLAKIDKYIKRNGMNSADLLFSYANFLKETNIDIRLYFLRLHFIKRKSLNDFHLPIQKMWELLYKQSKFETLWWICSDNIFSDELIDEIIRNYQHEKFLDASYVGYFILELSLKDGHIKYELMDDLSVSVIVVNNFGSDDEIRKHYLVESLKLPNDLGFDLIEEWVENELLPKFIQTANNDYDKHYSK